MTDQAKLGITVDTADLDRAVACIDRLAAAAERASAALENLAGQPHGGLVLKSIGEITHLTIKPVVVADLGASGLAFARIAHPNAGVAQRTGPSAAD